MYFLYNHMHLGMIVILITGNRRIGWGKHNEGGNILPSILEALPEGSERN